MRKLLAFVLIQARNGRDVSRRSVKSDSSSVSSTSTSSSTTTSSLRRSSKARSRRFTLKEQRRSVTFSLQMNTYHEGRVVESQDELRELWYNGKQSRQRRVQKEGSSAVVQQSIYIWLPHYLFWRFYILLCGELLFMYFRRTFLEFTSLMFLCENIL
mmetsp:Transcript_1649/g.3544  ORF Transcript_1649/g.3544 Transcript_1649/m.3544 type:complete len:157 (-) Transcript_1649:125-595(-)